MPDQVSRRDFLSRAAAIAAGVATYAALPPGRAFARAELRGEDLVDAGDGFRRGVGRDVGLVATPDGPALRATADGGVFTSGALRGSFPFTHVGLRWVASVPSRTGLQFEVRTSADGVGWSHWRAVTVDCLPGKTADGATFASLVYARGARFVQYRATFRTATAESPSLRLVVATVVDSPAVATSGLLTPTTTIADGPSGRDLALTSRELWEAEESYRFKRNNREIWPEMFVPAKKLIVHHTATRNDYLDAGEALSEVRAIYYYHAVTKQWGDVGYSALVDRFGNVYEGRHGRGGDPGDELASREVLSKDVVAGHDYAHNYGSVGVALLGDSTRADWPMRDPSGPMWDALARYAVFEAGRHFVRPLKPGVVAQSGDADIAVSDFLRSDDVWADQMRNVSGHRETNSTTCPGDVVMAHLDDLRNAIHAGLADTSRTGVALSNLAPGGRETTVGKTVSYAWTAETPEAGWSLAGYQCCVEGWRKPSQSEDVTYLSGYEAGKQPHQKWSGLVPDTSLSFVPGEAGHYTVHVRAVLDRSGLRRSSAYGASHTFLVKAATPSPPGRKPK